MHHRINDFGLVFIALGVAACAAAPLSAQDGRSLVGHTDAVTGVAISGDAKTAVSCSEDKTVRVWDLKSAKETRRFSIAECSFSAVTISPDGKQIAAAGRDHVIRLWRVAAPGGAEPRLLKGHADVINHVAFSPNSARIASSSWDGTVRVWDAATGKDVWKGEGHSGSVNGVRYSPDGKAILSGGADHTVRIWDAATGREIRRFEGHADWVGDVTFSGDGKTAVSAGGKNEPVVLMWGSEARDVKLRIDAPPDPGWGVATADRCLLVIQESEVGLFDPASGAHIGKLTGHAGQIYGLAISRDGKQAVAGGTDKIVRVWQLDPRPLDTKSIPQDRSVRTSWRRIERWIDKQFPILRASLRPGATLKQVQEFEKAIGQSLPEDVKESWMIHDGQGSIPLAEFEKYRLKDKSFRAPQNVGLLGNPLLPLLETKLTPTGVSVLSEWKTRQRLAAPDAGKGLPWTSWPVDAIQPGDSKPGWIPLGHATDSDFFGVDLNPGPKGQIGQVINFGRDQENKFVIAKSWGQFLADLADELEAGNYILDPEREYGEFWLQRPETGSFFFNRKAWAEAKSKGALLKTAGQ